MSAQVASAKLLKSGQGFYLYQTENCLELYKGKITGKYSFQVGYVSNAENFGIAVFEAKEELQELFAQAKAEFGGK